MDEYLDIFSNIPCSEKDDPSHFFFCFDEKEFAEQSYALRMINNKLRGLPAVNELKSELSQIEAMEKSGAEKNAVKQTNFYVPCMAKPVFPRPSDLNFFEMRECYFLMRGRMKEQLNLQEQNTLASYISRIKAEGSEFQTFVETIWRRQNFRRYLEMPEAAKLFIEQYWQKKINSELRQYPNFYNKLTTVPLVYDDLENPVKMEFQRCLHSYGELMQLRVPNPRKKHVLEKSEMGPLSSFPKETQLHYQRPVSLDALAGPIAIQNEANFVLSSSSFKKLVDNFYPNFTNAWELPIVVKEFKIAKQNKRVIFIDKALPSLNLTTAEKSKWYTKKTVISLLSQADGNMQIKGRNAGVNHAEMTSKVFVKPKKTHTKSLDTSIELENLISVNTPAQDTFAKELSKETKISFSNQTQIADSHERLSSSKDGSPRLALTISSCESDMSTSSSSNCQSGMADEESHSELLDSNDSPELKVRKKDARAIRQNKGMKTTDFNNSRIGNVENLVVCNARIEAAQNSHCEEILPKRRVKIQQEDDPVLSNRKVTRFTISSSFSNDQIQNLIPGNSNCFSDDQILNSSEEISPTCETVKKKPGKKRNSPIADKSEFSRKTRSSGTVTAVVENEVTPEEESSRMKIIGVTSKFKDSVLKTTVNGSDKSEDSSPKTEYSFNSKKPLYNSTSPELRVTGNSRTLRSLRPLVGHETQVKSSESDPNITQKINNLNISATTENFQSSKETFSKRYSRNNKTSTMSACQTHSKRNKKDSTSSNVEEPVELADEEIKNDSNAKINLCRKTRSQTSRNAELSSESFDSQNAKVLRRKVSISMKQTLKCDSDYDSDSDNLIIDFEDEDLICEDYEKNEESAKYALPTKTSAVSPIEQEVEEKSVPCRKEKTKPYIPRCKFYQEVGDTENSRSCEESRSKMIGGSTVDEPKGSSTTNLFKSDILNSKIGPRSETNLSVTSSDLLKETFENQPLDKFSFEEAKASIDESNALKRINQNNRQIDRFYLKEAIDCVEKNDRVKKDEKTNQQFGKFCFEKAKASMEKNSSVKNDKQDDKAISKFSFKETKANITENNSPNDSKYNGQPLNKSTFEEVQAGISHHNTVVNSKSSSQLLDKFSSKGTEASIYSDTPANNSECNTQPLGKFSFEEAKASNDKNNSAKNSESPKRTSGNLDSIALGGRMNVSYTLWTLHKEDTSRILLKSGTRSLTLLIRTKNAGTIQEGNEKCTVNPTTKVEYNPEFGASCLTLSESVQTWADLFIKPYTNSLRVRVSHSDYEVMMTEKIQLMDAIMELQRLHSITPQHCHNNLYSVLVKLADLDVGNYTLCHEPRDGAFAVLYKAVDSSFGSRSLQHSYQKTQSSFNERCPFIPIDSLTLTPANHFNKTVPTTFCPRYVSKKSYFKTRLPSVPVKKVFGWRSSKSKSKKKKKKKKANKECQK